MSSAELVVALPDGRRAGGPPARPRRRRGLGYFTPARPIGPLTDVTGVIFSGGVAEYVYGNETRDFGDLGRRLGLAIAGRLDRSIHSLSAGASKTALSAASIQPAAGPTCHVAPPGRCCPAATSRCCTLSMSWRTRLTRPNSQRRSPLRCGRSGRTKPRATSCSRSTGLKTPRTGRAQGVAEVSADRERMDPRHPRRPVRRPGQFGALQNRRPAPARASLEKLAVTLPPDVEVAFRSIRPDPVEPYWPRRARSTRCTHRARRAVSRRGTRRSPGCSLTSGRPNRNYYSASDGYSRSCRCWLVISGRRLPARSVGCQVADGRVREGARDRAVRGWPETGVAALHAALAARRRGLRAAGARPGLLELRAGGERGGAGGADPLLLRAGPHSAAVRAARASNIPEVLEETVIIPESTDPARPGPRRGEQRGGPRME